MYQPLEPQHAGTFSLQALDAEADAPLEKPVSAHADKMQKPWTGFLAERMNEPLTLAELTGSAHRLQLPFGGTRMVERPAGVRGTLAMREIAQGLGLIRGALTRERLAKAAVVALSHRIRLAQGDDICMESLLKSIISRAVYGIPLFPEDEEREPEKRRPMTPEEMAQALQGLTDAAFRQLGPEEALPVNDPAFGQRSHEASAGAAGTEGGHGKGPAE